MKQILEVDHITKSYGSFTLENISFSCPEGSIMGLIGANGAGKTTIINSIMNIIHPDKGEVRIFGKSPGELTGKDREKIAVVYDENTLPERFTSREISKVFKNLYTCWDEASFQKYLERLQIPSGTMIKKMSRGNKLKLNLAAALSHRPQLLILDEITGALDPVMRSEILKLFLEFIEDEHKSILFSSHIITDLEKIADYITFVNNGHLIFTRVKDELLYEYKIIKCGAAKFQELDKRGIVASLNEEGHVTLLAHGSAPALTQAKNLLIEEPEIEEIMLILTKGAVL